MHLLAIDRALTIAFFLTVSETPLLRDLSSSRIDDVYGAHSFVEGDALVFQQNLNHLTGIPDANTTGPQK